MTQPAKVQEPSMEEILASIRRIIADDEAKPAAAEKAAPVRRCRKSRRAAPRGQARDEGYSAVGDRLRRKAGCRQSRCLRRLPHACAGRKQQPGRYRRDAGEPRRGDARGRYQAAAARRRCVRTHRRDGAAGSAPARCGRVVPQGRSAGRYRIHRNAPAPGRCTGSRPTSRRRSKAPPARRRSRSCRARPCRRSNPPSIRWPIPC